MADTSFASLNPTLLARKGGAKPAMRPQAMAGVSGATAGAATPNLEDLGWNDMGGDEDPATPAVAQLTPAPTAPAPHAPAAQIEKQQDRTETKPVVHAQQDKLTKTFAEPAPQLKISKRPKGQRAAFTLRLNAERHLRLRLASTVQGRSAQIIVTEALDALLAKIPELEALAEQIQPKEIKKEGT